MNFQRTSKKREHITPISIAISSHPPLASPGSSENRQLLSGRRKGQRIGKTPLKYRPKNWFAAFRRDSADTFPRFGDVPKTPFIKSHRPTTPPKCNKKPRPRPFGHYRAEIAPVTSPSPRKASRFGGHRPEFRKIPFSGPIGHLSQHALTMIVRKSLYNII